MEKRTNCMNKITVIVGLVLCLSFSALAQQKGATLVPKFALKWTDLDSSWRGFLKGELKIEQNGSGNLSINGAEDWKTIPFFPAFTGSGEGLKSTLYRSEYSRPSIVAYKIDNIERKKEFTEVKLSKLNDRVVDLRLRFGNSITDVGNALQALFFVGNLEEFGKSEYFINQVMPKMLIGTKSENLSQEEKLLLMKGIGYDVNSLKVFKQKLYLRAEFKDTIEFNSNLVNEVERAARTIRKYFPEMKKMAKVAASFKEFEGVEIETTLRYRNFSAKLFDRNSTPDFDSFEFYVPIEILRSFAEAEITDQELVDKSFVILNGSRIRLNLSQFSN